jgi:hypothetical protein
MPPGGAAGSFIESYNFGNLQILIQNHTFTIPINIGIATWTRISGSVQHGFILHPAEG